MVSLAVPVVPAATCSVEAGGLRVRGPEGATRLVLDLSRIRASWEPVSARQLLGIFYFRGGDRAWRDMEPSPAPWVGAGPAPLAWWSLPEAPWAGLALEGRSRKDGGLDLEFRWQGEAPAPTRLTLSWGLGAEEGL